MAAAYAMRYASTEHVSVSPLKVTAKHTFALSLKRFSILLLLWIGDILVFRSQSLLVSGIDGFREKVDNLVPPVAHKKSAGLISPLAKAVFIR